MFQMSTSSFTGSSISVFDCGQIWLNELGSSSIRHSFTHIFLIRNHTALGFNACFPTPRQPFSCQGFSVLEEDMLMCCRYFLCASGCTMSSMNKIPPYSVCVTLTLALIARLIMLCDLPCFWSAH